MTLYDGDEIDIVSIFNDIIKLVYKKINLLIGNIYRLRNVFTCE